MKSPSSARLASAALPGRRLPSHAEHQVCDSAARPRPPTRLVPTMSAADCELDDLPAGERSCSGSWQRKSVPGRFRAPPLAGDERRRLPAAASRHSVKGKTVLDPGLARIRHRWSAGTAHCRNCTRATS